MLRPRMMRCSAFAALASTGSMSGVARQRSFRARNEVSLSQKELTAPIGSTVKLDAAKAIDRPNTI